MMTYEELAEWWKVPRGTIYSWVSRGCIPHVRLAAKSVRFERETLDPWMAARRQNAKPLTSTRGRPPTR